MNRLTASGWHFCPSPSSPSTATTAATTVLALHRGASLPFSRHYATQKQQQQQPQTPSQSRRAVTPFNDDGRVPWTQLSAGEKSGRAVQQTFNFGLVLVGITLTGGVGYFLYQEVFSPDSKTAYFNRAVDRIKKDVRCLELLGESKKITAYGEETHNKWRRARPIASTLSKDGKGNDHLMIQFNVQGPKSTGVVHMHLIRRAGQSDFEYKYFFVDVKGHSRIYLENSDGSSAANGDKQKGFKLFGVKWA